MNKLSPIMPQLLVSWPSFFNTNDDFWGHEWLKHGTCAQLGDELKYFQTTLNLKNRLPILQALNNAGIRPGTTKVSAGSIVQAIKDQLSVPVTLSCVSGNYLSEIHICVTKDFQFMDCPSDKKAASDSCNYSVFFYPIENS
jgi:ribonuclease I